MWLIRIIVCLVVNVGAITTMGFFEYTNETAVSAPGLIDLFSGNITWGQRIQYIPGYVTCNFIAMDENYIIVSSSSFLKLAKNGSIIDTIPMNYSILTMSIHPASGFIYAIGIPNGSSATRATLLSIDFNSHNITILVEEISSASGVIPCSSAIGYTDVFVYVIQEAAILHKVCAYNIRENTTICMFYSGWIQSVANAPIGNDYLVSLGVAGNHSMVISMDPRYNETQEIVKFSESWQITSGSLYMFEETTKAPPFFALGYTLMEPNVLVTFAENKYKLLKLNMSDAIGIVGLTMNEHI